MDSLGQTKLVALTRRSTLSRGFLLEDDLNLIASKGSRCLGVRCHMAVPVTGCDFGGCLVFFLHVKAFVWNHPVELLTLVHRKLCSHHFSVNTHVYVGSYT